jgi:hypothetical protein
MQTIDWWILAVMGLIFIAALVYRHLVRNDTMNELTYTDGTELVDGIPIENVEPS